MTFQDNLRHYREKAGYSQAKDFAAAIGVKYSTYIGYESQGKEPKYDTLRRIAEALNVSIDTLLGFSGVDRYEEYRQLLERSGCHVTERQDGILVTLPTGKFIDIPEEEPQEEVPFFEDSHSPYVIFATKASFCACVAGIVADFDKMQAPAKEGYIPLALLRYIMESAGSFSTPLNTPMDMFK